MNLAAYLFGQPFVPPAGRVREIRMDPKPVAPPCNATSNADIRAANVKLLKAFLAAGPATATEIAADIGVATPTARRILTALIDLGEVSFEIEDNVRLYSNVEQKDGAK